MVVGSLVGGAIGGSVISIVVKAVDDYTKTLDDVENKTKKVNKTMVGAGAAIGAAGLAGAAGLSSLAKEAGKGVGVAKAFNSFFGEMADDTLATLREATKGTVSDIDLMTQANQAMLLGIDPKALPEMFEGAFAAAQATGRPVADAIGDITTGIGRQSKLILDNLGIIVKQEVANKKYAEKLKIVNRELTEEEKKAAFTNEVMEALAINTERIGELTDTAATATQRANAQWDNAKQSLGENLQPILISVTGFLTSLIEKFNALSPTAQKWIAIGAAVAVGLMVLAGPILMIIGLLPILTAGIGALTAVSLPWLAIILAVIAAIIAIIWLIKNWSKVTEFFAKVWATQIENIKKIWQGFKDFFIGIWNGIKQAIFTIANSIIGVIEGMINGVINGMNKLIKGINKVPGINIPSIPLLNIPRIPVNDFILTKEGKLIQPHPNDTIMGFKPGGPLAGGMGQGTVVINIDKVQGLSAREISKALYDELRGLITV